MTATLPTPALRTDVFPWGRMLLLALAVFTTVTAEMLPAGVLPQIADEFGVGIGTAGVLLSAWAVTIAVASLPLVRVFAQRDRRTLLVFSLTVMALANVGVAVAPFFEVAVGLRIVGAGAHGVFWSVVMVYAAAIASKRQTGRAVTVANSGASAALLLGIPAGTALGTVVGWRAGFVILAVLMFVAAAAIHLVLAPVPPIAPPPSSDPGRRHAMAPIVMIGVVQMLVAFAQFSLYTYISPFLTSEAGVEPGLVSVLLFAFGVGGLIGLAAAGVTADRFPRAALLGALGLLAAALATTALASSATPPVVVALVVWGIAIGALPPLLLARTLRLASAPLVAIASAVAVVAFNVGIGAGAALGGVVVETVGLPAAASLAAVVALAAFALGAVSLVGERRSLLR